MSEKPNTQTETHLFELQVSKHEDGCFTSRICCDGKVLVDLPERFCLRTDAAATALFRLSSKHSWSLGMALGASEEAKAEARKFINGEQQNG